MKKSRLQIVDPAEELKYLQKRWKGLRVSKTAAIAFAAALEEDSKGSRRISRELAYRTIPLLMEYKRLKTVGPKDIWFALKIQLLDARYLNNAEWDAIASAINRAVTYYISS
jgi:hypothetical protein